MSFAVDLRELAPLRYLRDSQWLQDEMEFIWRQYFSDVPRRNSVDIQFSAYWKTRLGVISMSRNEETTYIGINGLLAYPEVPSYVTVVTIAHELVHYAHGFGSPLPRRYRHPHRGGIVDKELRKRGLAGEVRLSHDWIHQHWYDFYASKMPVPYVRRRG